MDLSSLPEDQRKQLQQLQQFQEHPHQSQPQQPQIHDYAPQAYDPSHAQPYDPSYYANYQSQDPRQSHHYSQPQHQNYDSYHQSDYANAHHQHHSQVDSALTHSQGVPSGEVQNPAGYGATLGLNPAAAAAVAALSQLAQFAGSMEAAEKAIALVGLQARAGAFGQTVDPGSALGAGQMHHGPPPFQSPGRGQPPYRGGGGRRGGRPFRGGSSRGRFGRGRGRGGPTHSPTDGSASSSQTNATEANAEVPETTQTQVPKQVMNPVPNKPPPQAARCELCQVDCTSLAILEQHKSGKKHKKNLQKAGKPVPETVEEGIVEETLPTKSVDIGSSDEQQNKVNTEGTVAEQSNVAAAAESHSIDQRRVVKRKTRGGGRGGKRVKSVETAKPRVVIPLICDLCNIRCDTQEVFDKHVGGKKHMSKLKRFEGHQAMYGPSGLQALYPPNPIAAVQTMIAPPPHQQTVYGPPPPEPYVPPQPHYSAPATVFQPNVDHQVPGPAPY